MASKRRKVATTHRDIRLDAIEALRAPAERWQHSERAEVDVRHPEGGPVRVERVSSGIAALVDAGRLEARHDTAARRWRRSYEGAFLVGRGTSLRLDRLRVDTSPVPSDGGLSHRLDAITEYQAACRAVGLMGDALLVLAVGEGMALNRIEAVLSGQVSALPADLQAVASRVRRMDRKAIAGAMVAVLDRLAEHYDEVDRAKAQAARERKAAAGRGEAA